MDKKKEKERKENKTKQDKIDKGIKTNQEIKLEKAPFFEKNPQL
jgi:hypothetical protein